MSMTFFLILNVRLRYLFLASGHCKHFKSFRPQPMVVMFRDHCPAWCDLPLTPNAQNAGMGQGDTLLAKQGVQAIDDIVRIARARVNPLLAV